MGFMNKKDEYRHQKLVVDLTERGMIIRIFFMAITLTVAGYAFYNIFAKVLRTEAGWQTIPVSKPITTASDEFVLRYNLGGTGAHPSEDWMGLTEKYPQLLERAYQTFSVEPAEGIGNLAVLNSHPNEVVEIEPELYAGLELLEENDSRYIYYAPVYTQYRAIFGCESDFDVDQFDPQSNPEVAAYITQVLAYAAEPDHIHIELLGDNRAKLVVSEEYAGFAAENEIGNYLDLFYWKNAFVMDEVAGQLIDSGYTAGILTCVDGFSRSLGSGDYAIPFYTWKEGGVEETRTLEYTDARAMIALYDFPIEATQTRYLYARQDGGISNAFIRVEDGSCVNQHQGLVVSSAEAGCSELLIKVWESFLEGEQDYSMLQGQGIEVEY